jgi:hypothetical protein
MNLRRALLSIWTILSICWVIIMGTVAGSDGVSEPTSEFRYSFPSSLQLSVVAPTRLSKDEVLAYIEKNDRATFNFCRANMRACRGLILLSVPTRTIYPRTFQYVAFAIILPAIVFLLGFVVIWAFRGVASRDRRFGNSLAVATILSIPAVLAEIIIVAVAGSDAARWAGGFTLICCGLCVILFVVGLFLFRLRGLWLVLPVIVALALPAGFVILNMVMMYNCEHDRRACI